MNARNIARFGGVWRDSGCCEPSSLGGNLYIKNPQVKESDESNMFSRALCNKSFIVAIVCLVSGSAFANTPDDWPLFNVNEIYTQEIGKIMYENCIQSLKDHNETDIRFHQTACYAHIVGALRMRDMILSVAGELGEDKKCLEYFSRSLQKWCRISSIKGDTTIYSLARSYTYVIGNYNSQYPDKSHHRYGTFSDFLLSQDFCREGIVNEEAK